MSDHSIYSPSGSERWMQCPGSISLEQNLRVQVDLGSGSNVYAREGTFAHDIAAQCLVTGKSPEEFIGHSDGEFTVDEEMAKYLSMYVDHASQYKRLGNRWLVEKRIDLSFLTEGMKGTGDFISELPEELHVMDLKYGKGNPVSPVENSQMMLYAIGQLQDLVNREASLKRIKKVFLHIAQPRCDKINEVEGPRLQLLERGRIRIWETSVAELKAFSRDVRDAIRKSKLELPPFQPGEKQCKWCACSPFCKHLADWSTQQAKIEFLDLIEDNFMPSPPSSLTKEEMANILKHWQVIEDWVNNIRAYAFREMEKGRDFPEHKLVRGRANRKWTNEQEVEKKLKEMGYKDNEIYAPRKIKSPAQAEALVGKRKVELEPLWHKPEGRIALVHVSDKREALQPNNLARDEFKDHIEGDDDE